MRVEGLAEPVAQQIQRHDGDEYRNAVGHRHPRRGAEVAATLGKLQPPFGVGGSAPNPRKLSPAAAMIDEAKPRVAMMMMGLTTLGSTWRSMIRVSRMPTARAARTYTNSRADNVVPRTTRA